MDYEKAYREALNRAMEINDGEDTRALGETVTEYIFPELKEKDDVKAKRIILALPFKHEADYKFVKTWLEKQGDCSAKWEKNTPDNKPTTNHSILMKTTQGIAEGEWQGEHWFQYRWSWILKDSDVLAWMELSDLDEQGEQKPTEWSKEDENRFQNIIACIEDCYNEKDAQDLIRWLKSFKNRVQPKQEWSDKDEEMYRIALSCIETLEDISNGKNMHADVKDWLKSLKDRIIGKED